MPSRWCPPTSAAKHFREMLRRINGTTAAQCAARACSLQHEFMQKMQCMRTAGWDWRYRTTLLVTETCLGDILLQGLQPEARRPPSLPRQRPGRVVGRFEQRRPSQAYQLQHDGMLSAPAPAHMLQQLEQAGGDNVDICTCFSRMQL